MARPPWQKMPVPGQYVADEQQFVGSRPKSFCRAVCNATNHLVANLLFERQQVGL
jgi:hypothetical protein